MRRLQFAVLLFACAFATGAAAEYPERPIHLIVPQAAGSATDTVARILGAALAEQIGQQVIVDDRPGGALTVGLDLTAKSAPDGYTICMGPIGALAITRHLVANLPYVIERDFQPIVVVAKGHLLLAVSPTVPFQTRHGACRLTPSRIPESFRMRRRATARPAMSAASCSSS